HIFRKLLTESQNLDWKRAEGYCAYRLGRALIESKQFEEAEHWLYHAEVLANYGREPLLQANVLLGRARLLWKQQRLTEAHTVAQASLALFQRLGSRDRHSAEALIAQLEEDLA